MLAGTGVVWHEVDRGGDWSILGVIQDRAEPERERHLSHPHMDPQQVSNPLHRNPLNKDTNPRSRYLQERPVGHPVMYLYAKG